MVRQAAWFISAGLVLALAGCEEVPAAAAKKPRPGQPAGNAAGRQEVLPVAADAYPSVDAALAEVEVLSSTSGVGEHEKLRQVEAWLNMQGDSIAPELAAKINDPSAGLATRLTCCRVLARLGPVATPPLLEAIERADPPQLRLKAIESLGRVKPSSATAVQTLMSLLDRDEMGVRASALKALATIGPEVKEFEPELVTRLIGMLNDLNEDETVRSLAKAALQKIDPRSGLQNAH